MAELIHTPLTVVHVIACAFLILVVLLQPGKSGGLGAFSGAAAQQVFGGRGAGNFLTKTTWVIAGVFFVSSISLAYLSSTSDDSLETLAAQLDDAAQAKKAPEAKVKAPVTTGSADDTKAETEEAAKKALEALMGDAAEGKPSDAAQPSEGTAEDTTADGESGDDAPATDKDVQGAAAPATDSPEGAKPAAPSQPVAPSMPVVPGKPAVLPRVPAPAPTAPPPVAPSKPAAPPAQPATQPTPPPAAPPVE